jgi:soluble lytic murein transglycosylase-like protein
MDLSKFSDDQLRIATKIIAESEKQGVNPDQIIPMAMAENMFGNKTSPAGALGPMQLTVGRAKMLNVDPKNEDENIRGGVTFFKQLYTDKKVGGGDPERLDRVYAAYNAGPGTQFVKTGNPNGGNLSNWPAYTTEKDQVLVIDQQTSATKMPFKDGLRILSTLY